MLWRSSAILFNVCIEIIKAEVPEFETRRKIYTGMILAFQGQEDWDYGRYCCGIDQAFDVALSEVNKWPLSEMTPLAEAD